MDIENIRAVCASFDVDSEAVAANPFGNGNINSTYLVTMSDGTHCVLQHINTNVFKNPKELMENVVGVTAFVTKKLLESGEDASRGTLSFFNTKGGEKFYTDNDGKAWRMYRCVDGATAYDSADKEGLLYEAAYAFGHFQKMLGEYDAETLFDTIPNFHNTASRYEAFETALAENAAGRADSVKKEIDVLRRYKERASLITDGLASGEIPVRVTHNDTKLNNVLIDDATGKGICVIDLDTVMSGSLLYDFGDSVRFAGNNGAEDDKELSNVWLDLKKFSEYSKGFLTGVGDAITDNEKKLLPMSVFILTYELALRFMTDYLNGDTYFKTKYPEHNIVRTRAQIKLMLDVDSKLGEMLEIINEI